jgi:ammonium transporter, Amt family
MESGDPQIRNLLDTSWVLVASIFVFFMQAGFKCLEVGLTRRKSATTVAMKNVVDWVIAVLFFFFIGFGLMFGHSAGGFVGTDLFALKNLAQPGAHALGVVFFLFQLAFAGTSCTIISGAMSERSKFIAYLICAIVVSALIYPVFGHWVWGGAYWGTKTGWLAALGFIDFAGSSVVHGTGAWVSLVGIWMVGPRTGRFDPDGTPRVIRANSPAYAALGVFILWVGWWGFNGGSTLAMNAGVGPILLNTNLAAAMGGLVALAHVFVKARHDDIVEKFLGGVLGGLVAVTAGCQVLDPLGALTVGALAGLVHNLGNDFLLRRRLDDPVSAIPVHGFCGVLGTLCVGIFGQSQLLPHDRLTQIGVQTLGAAVCFAWATLIAFPMFWILKRTVGLRVSVTEEDIGAGLTPDIDMVSASSARKG